VVVHGWRTTGDAVAGIDGRDALADLGLDGGVALDFGSRRHTNLNERQLAAKRR